MLESARSSILLILWYVFKDDPKIAEVATIIKAKLKQGVKVRASTYEIKGGGRGGMMDVVVKAKLQQGVKVRKGVCAGQLQVMKTRVGAG